ncbi:hypothetical protein SLA2020_272760 [Shorea laevis]
MAHTAAPQPRGFAWPPLTEGWLQPHCCGVAYTAPPETRPSMGLPTWPPPRTCFEWPCEPPFVGWSLCKPPPLQGIEMATRPPFSPIGGGRAVTSL